MTASDTLPTWNRPHFVAGGGNPRLFYKVYGPFGGEISISAKKFRSKGLPAGCDLRVLDRAKHAEAFGFGFDGVFGERLKEKGKALHAAAISASHCLVVRGEIADPATLDYFRDVIGVLTALIEQGAALFDPYILDWWSPDDWRANVFEAQGPAHPTVT